MTTITLTEIGIAVCISVFSIILSIFLIRMVANLLIVVAFVAAMIAPIGWFMHEIKSGNQMPIETLYLGAILFAFVITLLTVPLWPVSSIMQWTGKSERKRLSKSEDVSEGSKRKEPFID